MTITQKEIEEVKQIAGKIKNNSGKIIVKMSGGYAHYGDIFSNLQHSYHRKLFYEMSVGARMDGLGNPTRREVYLVFRRETEDIQVVLACDFEQHFVVPKDYESIIPT